MAELFTITAATNSVKLNNKRQAEVAFTVSNAENRPLRGRAHILPEGQAAPDWFSLAAEAEQNFAVAGTQQYTVKIEVPSDAAAGDYFFRLNMVGVENPDEDFSEGPSVSFAVPEPEEKKKPFPWWILLVILAVLVIGGAAAFLLTRGEAALAVAVDVSADPIIAGRNMTYTIQVNNTGNKTAENVIVKNTLPNGVTFVSASEESCAVGEAGEVVTCTLADGVGGNDTVEITLDVSVDGGARGPMTNTVTLDTDLPTTTPEATAVTEPEAETGGEAVIALEAAVSTEVVGQVSLGVEMTGPDSAAADEEMVYLVSVSNNGPSHATDVFLTYPRPEGILGATGVSPKGNCTETEENVHCDLGLLEAGTTLPVTITVSAGPEVVGSLAGQVTVTDGDGSTVSSNEVATQVEPATGLAMVVNTSGSQALIGQPFVYNVRIWNSSSVAANDVEMRYTIPDDWEFISTEPECPQQLFANTLTIICDFGDFSADPEDVRSVAVTLRASTEGTTENNFTISSANLPDDAVTLSTRVAKAFSQVGVNFDGKNDWMELNDFNVPETFTLEMWVNPEASRDQQSFISKQLADGSNVFSLGYYQGGLNVTLREEDYAAGAKTTGLYHLAVVVEKRTLSQSFVTVYQNGEVFWDHEFAAVLGDNISGKPWTLGQDWSGSTLADFLDGTIAEVRIWDHARSREQILGLMDERLNGNESGLIAYLPLTEQSGTTAADLTGSGHDGQVYYLPEAAAYWSFDDGDTAPDLTGNMNTGTVNGLTFTTTVPLSLTIPNANSLALDGNDDYVSVPDSTLINQGAFPQRTVSVWFNATDPFLGNRNQIIWEEGGVNNGLNIYLYYGSLYAGAYSSVSNWADGTWLNVPIQADTWYHVVLVLNSTSVDGPKADALKLYLNGQLVGTGPGAQLGNHTGNIAIGDMRNDTRNPAGFVAGSGGYSFLGLIDDVRIFNVALSEADIMMLSRAVPLNVTP